MATFKHISSKNADYGAAEQYLTFEHDEFTMKPTLDENGLFGNSLYDSTVCPKGKAVKFRPRSAFSRQGAVLAW